MILRIFCYNFKNESFILIVLKTLDSSRFNLIFIFIFICFIIWYFNARYCMVNFGFRKTQFMTIFSFFFLGLFCERGFKKKFFQKLKIYVNMDHMHFYVSPKILFKLKISGWTKFFARQFSIPNMSSHIKYWALTAYWCRCIVWLPDGPWANLKEGI